MACVLSYGNRFVLKNAFAAVDNWAEIRLLHLHNVHFPFQVAKLTPNLDQTNQLCYLIWNY